TQYAIPTAGSFPAGITAGADGRMWFTEYAGNKIGAVSSFGVFKEYSLPTANSFPFSILSAADQKLYVTLQGTDRISPFNVALKTFDTPIVTSEGPSGIAGLPVIGMNQSIGFVTADANKFGLFPLIANPSSCGVMLDKKERAFDAGGKK